MAQLWGGRFTKETDKLVYNFNASIKMCIRDRYTYSPFHFHSTPSISNKKLIIIYYKATGTLI